MAPYGIMYLGPDLARVLEEDRKREVAVAVYTERRRIIDGLARARVDCELGTVMFERTVYDVVNGRQP